MKGAHQLFTKIDLASEGGGDGGGDGGTGRRDGDTGTTQQWRCLRGVGLRMLRKRLFFLGFQ